MARTAGGLVGLFRSQFGLRSSLDGIRTMKKALSAVAGVVTVLAVTTSQGAGQVIAGPNGPVEFIGLQD